MKKITLIIYAFIAIAGFIFLCKQIYISRLNEATLKDLNFMHQIILENHPTYIDDKDPDFISKITFAYNNAKNKISKVKNSNDHKEFIKYYTDLLSNMNVHFNSSNTTCNKDDFKSTFNKTEKINSNEIDKDKEIDKPDAETIKCHIVDLPSKIGQIQFFTKSSDK